MHQRESQDEEELKLNQLAETHLKTPNDEVERALVRPESLSEDKENEEIEMIIYAAPLVIPRLNKVYEVLERKGDEELPPPILKPLPKGLMYEFVDNTERFPIIVNADLSGKENEKLLTMLTRH